MPVAVANPPAGPTVPGAARRGEHGVRAGGRRWWPRPIPTGWARHFRHLARRYVALSDAEANTWGMLELFVIAFSVVAFVRTTDVTAEAGTVFATISYVWKYTASFEALPQLSQQLANLTGHRPPAGEWGHAARRRGRAGRTERRSGHLDAQVARPRAAVTAFTTPVSSSKPTTSSVSSTSSSSSTKYSTAPRSSARWSSASWSGSSHSWASTLAMRWAVSTSTRGSPPAELGHPGGVGQDPQAQTGQLVGAGGPGGGHEAVHLAGVQDALEQPVGAGGVGHGGPAWHSPLLPESAATTGGRRVRDGALVSPTADRIGRRRAGSEPALRYRSTIQPLSPGGPSLVNVTVEVNGTSHTHDVEPRRLLVHYLREDCGLTGTNVGCDTSSCGACTVHLNGESVKSCTVLAVQADGSGHHDRGPGRRTASCTPCRRPSTRTTACSAATARRAW